MKLFGLVNSFCEEKHQLLDEIKKLKDESVKEQQALRQENAKLKEDLNEALRYRDANIHERGAVHRREYIPQKRQRAQQSSDDEYEGPSNCPRERVRANPGVSREQIRNALGGFDRGWGSTESCSGLYTHHALLDVELHLFSQTPSRRQNVAEGVFGFGPDDGVISGAIEFPLFVRGLSGAYQLRFTYLGNYVAIRLDPVAWERLSEKGKICVVQTVQSKGLSADPCAHRMEKTMEHGAIYDKFRRGIFKVPCSRLEFRGFDQELNTEVQDSPGRLRP